MIDLEPVVLFIQKSDESDQWEKIRLQELKRRGMSCTQKKTKSFWRVLAQKGSGSLTKKTSFITNQANVFCIGTEYFRQKQQNCGKERLRANSDRIEKRNLTIRLQETLGQYSFKHSSVLVSNFLKKTFRLECGFCKKDIRSFRGEKFKRTCQSNQFLKKLRYSGV